MGYFLLKFIAAHTSEIVDFHLPEWSFVVCFCFSNTKWNLFIGHLKNTHRVPYTEDEFNGPVILSLVFVYFIVLL